MATCSATLGLAVALTGHMCCGKDFVASALERWFIDVRHCPAARFSIGSVTKRLYAAEQHGLVDADALINDRAVKETHRAGLTAFYEKMAAVDIDYEIRCTVAEIKRWAEATPGGVAIVCDLRMPNELEMLTAELGPQLRVVRVSVADSVRADRGWTGPGPQDTHVTETALDAVFVPLVLDNSFSGEAHIFLFAETVLAPRPRELRVAIEGVLASGKTTLLQALAPQLNIRGWTTELEPVHLWGEALALYAAAPQQHALALQLVCSATRAKATRSRSRARIGVVSERSIASDIAVFGHMRAEAGLISSSELGALETMASALESGSVDAVVLLDVSPEIAIEWAASRGRPYEEFTGAAIGYQRALAAAYERWIERLVRSGVPVLRVTPRGTDTFFESHCDEILAFIESVA